MREDDYDEIVKKVILKDDQYVQKEYAETWLYNNLVCNPDKRALDDMRSQEVDTQDLMQNTSILYHSESIIEMQILCTITVLAYANALGQKLEGSSAIFTAFFLEHTFSYAFTVFRDWEIERHGKLDLNGVLRGPKEAIIKPIQILLDCLLTGFSMNYLMNLT
jgi:hypothetical protein